jgi:hypothetical protein
VAEEEKDKDEPYYSIDGAGTEEIKEPDVSYESMGEIPLAVLKPTSLKSSWALFVCFVFFFGLLTLIWIVIPVLTAGDITAVKLDSNPARSMKGILLGLVFFFCCIPWFIAFWIIPSYLNAGTICFYSNRLELIRHFGKGEIRIIPYKKLYVSMTGDAMVITTQSIPSPLHPLQRYKVLYCQALRVLVKPPTPQKIFGMDAYRPQKLWEHPENAPKAVQILREKAFEFKEG